MTETTPKKPRGFASMSLEQRREIAVRGGVASHQEGASGREWTPEEARAHGSAGGKKAHASGKAHEWTSEQAREAGRKGGRARWAKRRQAHKDACQDGLAGNESVCP